MRAHDAPPQDRARCVPDIFDEYVRHVATAASVIEPGSVTYATAFSVEARLAQDNPRLYWVDGPMLELAAEVAARLPDDTQYDDIEPPSASGFIVFAERLYGVDALSGERTTPLDGMAWTPVRIRHPYPDGEVFIGRSYLAIHRAQYEADEAGPAGSSWLPLGRSDWCHGEAIGEIVGRRMDGLSIQIDYDQLDAFGQMADLEAPSLVESAEDDRRLLAALWMLMKMERAADVSQWAPRSKSAKRRTKDRQPSVTVIHLRRERGVAGPPLPDGGEHGPVRKYRHRWFVAPHPRWQAYGPGHAQRKLILVDGYVKGPEDAPFVQRRRVWSLDR